jgi:hypothetical protein
MWNVIYGMITSTSLWYYINFRNIDSKLENRTKRIQRLEALVRDSGKGDIELKAEIAKLKSENRALKVLTYCNRTDKQSEYSEILSKSRARSVRDRENRDTPSPSRNVVGTPSAPASNATATSSQSTPTNGSAEKRWLLRFQELETRLKAEQEGRALDQKGAKLRLDEVRKENAELKNEIKEKEREGSTVGSSSGSAKLSKEKGDSA